MTTPAPTLTIDGEVERPSTAPRPAGEVTVAALLDRAGPAPGADHATVHAADGEYLASIPLSDLRTASLTAGRLLVPAGRTKCWNVKDVVRIELTTGPRPDSVPENPPH